MRQTITMVKKELDKFFRQFRVLRSRMMTKAQVQGIYSDQDVFKRVS